MSKYQKLKNYVFLFALLGLALYIAYSAEAAESNRLQPTVEDCVERTGKTESECKEMMENFKGAPPENMGQPKAVFGKGQAPANDQTNEENESEYRKSENINQEVDRITQNKEKLENIQIKIENIIKFLKSKNIDCTQVESNFAIYNEKVIALQELCDSRINILENGGDKKDPRTAMENLDNMKNSIKDLKDYYDSNMKTLIIEAIKQVTD